MRGWTLLSTGTTHNTLLFCIRRNCRLEQDRSNLWFLCDDRVVILLIIVLGLVEH